MYRIYQTNALIASCRGSGEADKVFTLLTPDFGMIHAHARGVREVRSKLRHALEEMCFVDVSLVRGKDVWRITNALPLWSVYRRINDPEKRKVLQRLLRLLKRLLPGEEGNSLLFETVSSGFSFLADPKTVDLRSFEAIFVLRVLSCLGYIGEAPLLKPFTGGTEFDPSLLSSMRPLQKEAIVHINHALRSSHL